jgi:uncharacterized membrane protein (UPF0127 family)
MVNSKPAAAAAAIFITFIAQSGHSSLRECRLILHNEKSRSIILNVEIADTDETRARGLMHRSVLRQDRGMLFVFQYDESLQFWMKNTSIPLSIAYVTSGGIITKIFDMKPLDESVRYPSGSPVRYAIEVNQGWFEKNGIKKGCRVVFDGCFGK